MLFKFKQYKYKPSFEIKTTSKIKSLKDKYEDIFLRYINDKNSLNKEEIEKLYSGIKEISLYIKTGMFYQLLEYYSSKTALSRKIEVLFYKAKQQYNGKEEFQDFIEEEILILAEDAIYEGLGLSEGIKFNKTEENSNMILFFKNKLFYKLLNFLENRVSNFQNLSFFLLNEDEEDLLEKEDFINKLIKDSNLEAAINPDIILRLKEALMFNNIDEDLIPYVEFLVEYKEKKC